MEGGKLYRRRRSTGETVMEEIIYKDLAKKYGLSSNFIIKDYYLMRLLQYVSLYGEQRFVLTGGTAINKVYLKENARFSEDADFELINKPSLNTIITSIDGIAENAREFLKKEKRLLKIYCQVDFSYRTSNEFTDSVRLDVAFNELADKNSFEIVDEIISSFSQEKAHRLAVYRLEELLARKMYALYRRTEGKDIYDIFYSLELADKTKFHDSLKRFISKKGIDFDSFILELSKKLRHVDSKYISAKTNGYIPLALRPSNWNIVSNSIADYLNTIGG